MIIAVATENGQIFQHFGKSQEFTLFETENAVIKGEKTIDTSATGGHSALVDVLKSNSVETLIYGGIGPGAIEGLRQIGVEVVSGVSGSAREAVIKYLSGEKIGSSSATCDHHHDSGHTCHSHEDGHTCGHHN